MNPRKLLFVVLSSLCVLTSSSFGQGSLTPPGTPAPTMKSLDQIASTGIAINSTNTPSTSSNDDFTISSPGSYYLTGNLALTTANGIEVTVAGVTIDLNGFQISGSGSNTGVTIDSAANGCVVRNGSISGFTNGVIGSFSPRPHGGSFRQLNVSACGFGLFAGDGWQIDGCHAHDNTQESILAGAGSTLTNCTATSNQGTAFDCGNNVTMNNCAAYNNNGSFGIITGSGSTLTNCAAYSNIGIGIYAGPGSTLANCIASSNTAGGGNPGDGIYAVSGSTLTNCTASSNTNSAIFSGDGCTITNCTGQGSGVGIRTGSDSKINGCTASGNGDGIDYTSNCLITGNNSSENSANGFHSFGSLNRIDGNTAMRNSGTGFLANGAIGDYVIRNTAGGNTPNYTTTGGNVGPIQSASTATNPFANLQ
jgi:hypothetical protein